MEEIKYYPKEISPIINGKSTLSANCMFFPLTEENIKNGSKPYDIHSNFSRVVITIIDYSDQNNKKTAKANIPAKRRINSLYRGTCLAADICRQHKWSGTASQKAEEEKKNPAYTVKISSGRLKGKTPAQLMLEDPDTNREELKKQYLWLQNNLSKYPNNKIQMNAISEAVNLYDAGALSEEEASNNTSSDGSFVVYEDQMKIPHADKKDERGLTDVYSFRVTCNPGKNYPFEVSIMNAMAPVKKTDKGTVMAVMQEAKDVVNLSFNASLEDFEAFVTDMWERKESFENLWFPTMYKKAEQLAREAAEARK